MANSKDNKANVTTQKTIVETLKFNAALSVIDNLDYLLQEKNEIRQHALEKCDKRTQ